jgi:hypothetical protein
MTGRFYSSDTQIKWACTELLKGRSISHKSEIAEVHGWRLAAIIHQLRRHYGWPILMEPKTPQRIGWYFLDPAEKHRWPTLKKPPSYFRSKAEYQEHLKDFDIPPTSSQG